MIRNLFLTLSALMFAVFAAPITLIAGSAGQADAANIYVVIESPLRATRSPERTTADARDLGPQTAPFARMIYAEPKAHARLVDQGNWIIPASALAALCGISGNLVDT